MSEEGRAAKELANQIANELFVNGQKEIAHRLVLTSLDGHDLGGWCKEAIADVIARHINAAAKLQPAAPEPRVTRQIRETGQWGRLNGEKWVGVFESDLSVLRDDKEANHG